MTIATWWVSRKSDEAEVFNEMIDRIDECTAQFGILFVTENSSDENIVECINHFQLLVGVIRSCEQHDSIRNHHIYRAIFGQV